MFARDSRANENKLSSHVLHVAPMPPSWGDSLKISHSSYFCLEMDEMDPSNQIHSG